MAPRKKKKDIGDIVGDAAKAVGRAAAQNPLVAQNIKYFNAVKAGPTQVAKTAAIDLAAGAAGAGARKRSNACWSFGEAANPATRRSPLLAITGIRHVHQRRLSDCWGAYQYCCEMGSEET
jgi:hypothetical protein